jgi:hypothetical protein
MLKIQILGVVCLAFSSGIFAQATERTSLNNGGNSLAANGIILDISIGQTAVSTLSQGNVIITQGFQQGYLFSVGTENTQARPVSVAVFPNPAHESLFIQNTDDNAIQDASWQIFGPAGQLVLSGQLSDTSQEINIEALPSGSYYVALHTRDHQYFTAKFLKIK